MNPMNALFKLFVLFLQASIQGTSDDIGHLLDLLLTKYSVSTNPHIRQVSHLLYTLIGIGIGTYSTDDIGHLLDLLLTN